MTDHVDRAVRLLRQQRHNFLNHLQVIAGWVQLGQDAKALAQIRQVRRRVESERRVIQQVDDVDVLLFVVETGLRAEAQGVVVEWERDGEVDPNVLREARPRVDAALAELAGLPAEQRRLRITLGNPVRLHTGFGPGEG